MKPYTNVTARGYGCHTGVARSCGQGAGADVASPRDATDVTGEARCEITFVILPVAVPSRCAHRPFERLRHEGMSGMSVGGYTMRDRW